MTGARSRHSTVRDRSTLYVLASGLAWGCIVTTAESLSQPPLELSLSDFLLFYPRILLHYGAAGILLAWLTLRISNLDRQIPAWVAAVPVIVIAGAFALLIDRLSIWYLGFWRNDLMASMATRTSDLAAHMAWIFGVYGGLYVLTFLFLKNEAQSRERLRQSELARVSAETQMDRALAENRSPPVAPDLLLKALAELGQRYTENHRRADHLLDMLVKLLRSASTPAKDGLTRRAAMRRTAGFAVNLGQLRAELGLAVQDSTPRETEHLTTGG